MSKVGKPSANLGTPENTKIAKNDGEKQKISKAFLTENYVPPPNSTQPDLNAVESQSIPSMPTAERTQSTGTGNPLGCRPLKELDRQ
jgi:hypothetical protein